MKKENIKEGYIDQIGEDTYYFCELFIRNWFNQKSKIEGDKNSVFSLLVRNTLSGELMKIFFLNYGNDENGAEPYIVYRVRNGEIYYFDTKPNWEYIEEEKGYPCPDFGDIKDKIFEDFQKTFIEPDIDKVIDDIILSENGKKEFLEAAKGGKISVYQFISEKGKNNFLVVGDYVFGDNISFGDNILFDSDYDFGEGCKFGNNIDFAKNIKFGPNCSFGDNVRFGEGAYFLEGGTNYFGKNAELYRSCMLHSDSVFAKNANISFDSIIYGNVIFEDCVTLDCVNTYGKVKVKSGKSFAEGSFHKIPVEFGDNYSKLGARWYNLIHKLRE